MEKGNSDEEGKFTESLFRYKFFEVKSLLIRLLSYFELQETAKRLEEEPKTGGKFQKVV